MSSETLITFVVPCYNQAEYLDEALFSVFNQTFKDWKCIIVNDGSTDNSEEVALNWVNKDNRFAYHKKENGGLSSARNFGINRATSKYIFPFDADDRIDKSYLEKAIEILKNNDNIEVLSSKVQFFGVKNSIYELPDYSFEQLLLKNCFIACSIFKKESYEKVGGYDENLKSFEDWDFWISILKDGGECHIIDEVLYFYRKHEENSLSNRFYTDKDFYYSLYDYVYKKHIDIYLEHFPNFIFVYKEYMLLKKFNMKVKRNPLFKFYEKIKSVFK